MMPLNTQLERLLQNAKSLESDEITEVVNKYRDLFNQYGFRLRPSVGSISLVSCSSYTPQLGFSNINSARALQEKLEALRGRRAKLEAPGRDTPEKALQSWLIWEAMQNEGRVASIERAVDDRHSYWFVSDEIALTDPETDKRLVADLLMVREDSHSEVEFVNVELKSQRTTGTHIQAKNFSRFIQKPERVALWRGFAETMLPRKKCRWKEPGECRGLVIWPRGSDPANPRERTVNLVNQYKAQGIDTISYYGPEYKFGPEHSPA
jgi:hypothetical protein